MAGSPEEVPPSTRRQIQEVDWGISHGWGAVCQAPSSRKKGAGLLGQQRSVEDEYSIVGISCPGTK